MTDEPVDTTPRRLPRRPTCIRPSTSASSCPRQGSRRRRAGHDRAARGAQRVELRGRRRDRRRVRGLDADPGCRVIVLTGDGERAFAAGADIKELAVQNPTDLAARGPVHALGPHPAHPQADRRRGPRLRPRRRLRAGDGLRHHRGRRRREVRPARDQARRDARRRWHATADTGDRQGQGDGSHPDRPDDRRPRGGGSGLVSRVVPAAETLDPGPRRSPP